MRTSKLGLMVSVGVIACWSGAFAASTSPGKHAAFESAAGTVPSTDTVVATAVIAKGKPKSVLDISATVHHAGSSTDDEICVYPTVNGVDVEPLNPLETGFFAIGTSTPATMEGTISGQFWLDLDAAEAASPGVFKNQQLNVDLHVFDCRDNSSDGSYTASLAVRMQKK